MLRPLLFILLTGLLLPAHAEDRAATEQQLQQARKEVAELQKLLGDLNQEKSSVLKRLKATEGEMGGLQKQINELEKQLKASEQEIQRLDEEKKKLQGQRDQQRALIAAQARAAYQGGQQEALKLLLNQEEPEQLQRLLTYHDYLARARNEQLESYKAILAQLKTIEVELTDRHSLLAGQRFELQGRRETLDKKLAEHKGLVAKLNREMGSGEQRLARMKREQESLDQALRELDRRLARERELQQRQRADTPRRDHSPSSVAERPAPASKPEAASKPATVAASDNSSWEDTGKLSFSQARGKMPLPLTGELLARFGSTREGDIRWDGMLIGAEAGSRVRAIHGGRVVFANWMKNLGMLLIVDHGGGYMSLYGYNQTLLKSVNDRVRAGEVIATVGRTGGQSTPSLYFSIRQKGQPVDPQKWCRTPG